MIISIQKKLLSLILEEQKISPMLIIKFLQKVIFLAFYHCS